MSQKGASQSGSLKKSRSNYSLPGTGLLSSLQQGMKQVIQMVSPSDKIAEGLYEVLFTDADNHAGPVILSNEPEKFKLFMAGFNGYDNSKDNPANVLKVILQHHLPKRFKDDLLIYVLLAYKLIKMNSPSYCEEQVVMEFVTACIQKLPTLEPESVARVVNDFIRRGDLEVCFISKAPSTHVFSLLSDGCKELLSLTLWSKGALQKPLRVGSSGFVYSRMLLISLALKFNDQLDSSLWKEELLKYSSEIMLDSDVVYEVNQGLQLGSQNQLGLSSELSFNYLYMTAFIVEVKMSKPFAIIEHYLHTVKMYIERGSDLKVLLGTLRIKFSELVKNSTEAISAMSFEWSLSGAISESLNLVNCIQEMCTTHDLEPTYIESECLKWLMIFIRMVNFRDNLETLHLHLWQFLDSKPLVLQIKVVHDEIVKYICNATSEILQYLTVSQFGSLFSKLGVYSATTVEEFLKKYRSFIINKISDSEWLIFLSQVIEKCKGAKNHSFLIRHFFQPAIGQSENKEFLSELLEVSYHVSGLFVIDDIDEKSKQESERVCEEFKHFLRGNIDMKVLQQVLSSSSTIMMSATTNKNNCEQLLFGAVHDYIAECDISSESASENFLDFIGNVVKYLFKDKRWVHPDITLKQKFCLYCINACCVRMTPTSDNLCRMQPHLINLIIEVGLVYSQYCAQNKLTNEKGHITHSGQQKLYTNLQECSDEVQSYFKWVSRMQEVLKELDNLFIEQEITVHAIMNFAKVSTQLRSLYCSMCMSSSWNINPENIEQIKQKCAALIEQINECLLIRIPHHDDFFTLPQMLTEYHVAFPQSLQDMIAKHVIIPSRALTDCDSSVQVSNQNCDPSIELSENITIREVTLFANELRKFNDQVACFTPMLAYFKYNNSVLFRNIYTTELQNLSCEEIGVEMSMDCFVQVLERADKLISVLCQGQVKYADIINLDPEELDITKEVEILRSYSDLDCTDTLNMLSLRKLTCQINSILLFCNEFGLNNCLCELQQRIVEIEGDDVRATSERVEHIKTLLCLSKNTSTECLDLFTAISRSDNLFQIIKDARICPQHEDIVTHLQSEISVVNNFASVIELLNPLLDANQDLESLMANVLKKTDEIKHGLLLLESLKAKLPLLVQVLSNESNREEKESVKIERDIQLHKECMSYKHQVEQLTKERYELQCRIDELQKVNNALRRKEQRLDQENQKFLQSNGELLKESEQLRSAHQESIAFGLEPWKVSRDKVKPRKTIGGGAYGTIYKGELEVAIKQFHPNILSPHNLDLLKREMKMLARIRHPNLVQFVAVVFEENDDNVDINPPYIVTELLDMSLREGYEKNLVSERSVYPIFQDTARALDYLHRCHEPIIHRDVSSANVLLKRLPNEMWMAKVSDLGSANFSNVAVTMNTGAIIYCAPEAFTDKNITRSKEALTPKVDVYSYGIMLCEVVTCKLPEKEIFQDLLLQAECKQPRLHPLILQCISQDPDKRPSMANVLTTIETLSL